MKDFSLNFSLSDSRYPTAVRLVVGSMLSSRDTDVDTIEDFKVAACEALLIIKSCGFSEASVTFLEGGEMVIEGMGGLPKESDNEFSLMLISALIEDMTVERQGVAISKVILKL